MGDYEKKRYKQAVPMPNKFLGASGDVSSPLTAGGTVEGATDFGLTQYKQAAPIPNKFLFPDGSVKEVDFGGGGGGGGKEPLVVESASSKTIDGYSIPEITDAQLTAIYNALMTESKQVFIVESSGDKKYGVGGVENDGGDFAAFMLFGDVLVKYSAETAGVEIEILGLKAKEVNIGANQYIYDNFPLPAIEKSILQKIYDNKKAGIPQQLKWTVVGETFFDVISADKLGSNYSIDILAHNKYHLSYTWADSTTGIINPDVLTPDVDTFIFKGYVAPSAPSNAKEGELWHNSASEEMPTTFPIAVKKYHNGAWSSATENYTPTTLEMWANINSGAGYYWFGNEWNRIDVTVEVDDATINKNALGQLQLKDKGHDASKIADAAIGAGLEKDSTGKIIKHKNAITAGTASATVAANSYKPKKITYDAQGHISAVADDTALTFTNGIKSSAAGVVEHTNAVTAADITVATQTASSAKTTAGGSVTFKKTAYDAQGHVKSASADDASNKITFADGLSLFANKVQHTNAVTATTAAKLIKAKVDAQGHLTGTLTQFEETKTIAETGASDEKLPTEKAVRTELDKKIDIEDIVDNLTSSDADKPLSAKQGKALNDLYNPPKAAFNLYFDDGTVDSYDFLTTTDEQVFEFTFDDGATANYEFKES